MVGDLTLDTHPALKALRDRYRGVVVMTTDPFEALVLTILSQNRTGETVRQVYPALAAACGGAAPERIAALDVDRLASLIRSAGPYKAPRLAETARIVAAVGVEAFDRIVRQPGPQALVYLESLPGVAHKTAACVLVFAAGTRTTLPVDTHLFRVVDRIGLATHAGRQTKTVRDELIDALLRHGADLAPAHFLFLLVGRSTCVAGTPTCGACFLAEHCQHATTTRRLEQT
jgi:endonuclease III